MNLVQRERSKLKYNKDCEFLANIIIETINEQYDYEIIDVEFIDYDHTDLDRFLIIIKFKFSKEYYNFRNSYSNYFSLRTSCLSQNNIFTDIFNNLNNKYNIFNVTQKTILIDVVDFESKAKDIILSKTDYLLNREYCKINNKSTYLKGYKISMYYNKELFVIFDKQKDIDKYLQDGTICKIKEKAKDIITKFDEYLYFNFDCFFIFVKAEKNCGQHYFDTCNFTDFIQV